MPSSQPLKTPMVISPLPPAAPSSVPPFPLPSPPFPHAVSAKAATDRAAADFQTRDFTVTSSFLYVLIQFQRLRSSLGESFLRLHRSQPVQVHSENHHGQSCFEPKTGVNTVQRSDDFPTEASGADHTGNNDHGEGQHNDLVDTCHDGRSEERRVGKQ